MGGFTGVSSVTKRLNARTLITPHQQHQEQDDNNNNFGEEIQKKRKRRFLRVKKWWRALLLGLVGTGTCVYVYFLPYENPKLIQLRDTTHRKDRFPSVEQRIQSYMGDWYLSPCPGRPSQLQFTYLPGLNQDDHDKTAKWKKTVQISVRGKRSNETAVTTISAGNKIKPDALLFMDEPILEFCARFTEWKNLVPWLRNNEFVEAPVNMFGYCRDVQDFLQANANANTQQEQQLILPNVTTAARGIPLLFTFGDNYRLLLPVPHFRKTRPAVSAEELKQVTSNGEGKQQSCSSKSLSDRPTLAKNTDDNTATAVKKNFLGILLKLNSETHYLRIKRVDMWDIPWHRKQDMAIFRGRLTGLPDDSFLQGRSEAELHHEDAKQCLRLARCNIVLSHRNSKRVTAKLVDTLAKVPDSIVVNDKRVNLVGSDLGMRKLLQHKAIIILQGNDVASGLKWALYSSSVVMMPIPTVTSWALEEMLEPWKHFIPINRDGSDAEDRMRWITDHPEEAQRIANYGTLWIEDLLFHPDAEKDAQIIQQEILRRYVSHFQ